MSLLQEKFDALDKVLLEKGLLEDPDVLNPITALAVAVQTTTAIADRTAKLMKEAAGHLVHLQS